MRPEEQAALAMAELAVRRFASACINHPRLEEDPQCVIATLREEYVNKIQECPLEQMMITPKDPTEIIKPKTNGQHAGRVGRNGHHKR